MNRLKPSPRSSGASAKFLAGGGELGALTRALDWGATPLGPPEHWPQSLKTAVRIMLTSSQPFWIGWGEDLTYLYNDAYKSIIGGKHPWALGRPASEVWREIWPDIAPMLATAMGGEEGIYVEQQLLIMERHGYREETYYTFSYSPIPDDDGNPGGIICANTDDTSRVIGERQIALLRELAAGASPARSWREACTLAAASFDADPRDLVFAAIHTLDRENDRLTLAAAHGIEPGHAAAPERLDLTASAAGAALRTGEAQLIADARQRYPDLPTGVLGEPPREIVALPIPAAGEHGRAGVLTVGLNPFRKFDDAYQGFLGLVAGQIAAAIANAEAYEDERRRAEALAELDRAKTTFFSNVSHEFRTPLTLMLGPLEEILAGPGDPVTVAAQVDVAHRNGLRLLKLVNTLLDFSRIEAGRIQARFRPTDLAEAVADLAANFRSATEQAGLTLDIETDPNLPPVYVDQGMLEKIVLNLVSNAFKFTLEGGIRVSVGPGPTPTSVAITVTDTGVGIPADEMPRLFERFHRIQGAKGRSFEGSGIGLALVHELVELHGGAIEVESREGEGSSFRVILPLGDGHLPPEQIEARAAAAGDRAAARAYVEEALRWLPDLQLSAEPASPLRSNEGRGRTVLLVDDNADMREYVARLLSGSGFEVQAAPDGEAALEILRRSRPDLVLTDVMMPRLDGFGLLKAIRADPALAELPVIMLSARAGEDPAIEGFDAGADDYLSKPFAARELLARVGANLALAEARREATAAVAARTAELETLLDTAPVCVFFTADPGAERIVSNRFALDLFRMSPGANVSVTGPDSERPSHFEVWRAGAPLAPADAPVRRAAGGEPVDGEEIEVRFDDGSVTHLLINAAPLKDDAGAVRGAVAIGVDITARRQAQAEREAAHRQLEELNATLERRVAEALAERKVLAEVVAGADAFVQVVDLDFRWMAINRAAADEFERFFGVRPRVGQSVLKTLADKPNYGVRLEELWRRALAGEAFTELVDLNDPAGERRCYELKFNALRGAGGERIGAFQFIYDITERVLEQERLALAEEQLGQARKMEAMGQLTGGVAHDFNNLLTPIIGGLDVLKRAGVGGERERRLIEGALQSADRAKMLVQRLLAFARRQPLQPTAVDVGGLVRGMAELVASTAGPQIRVVVEVADDIAAARADPNQLEMALLNLAVNARDAMPGGGTIRISASNAEASAGQHPQLSFGPYVRVSVADTGVGMDEATVARAVEPFFSTKGIGKGTGLGLSMVHGLVQQLGGALTIHSRPGLGANVELWLPQSQEAPVEAGRPHAAVEAAGERGMALLVDDEALVRASTADMLAELGYDVTEVASAEEALGRLDAGLRPAVVITDHLMPGMTGVDLARWVGDRLPTTRVLIVSGYADMEGIEPDLPRLTKPFLTADLAAALADLG